MGGHESLCDFVESSGRYQFGDCKLYDRLRFGVGSRLGGDGLLRRRTLYRSGVEMMTAHMEYGTNLTVNSGALESAATEKFGPDFNAAAPLGIGNIDLRSRAHTLLGKDYGFDLRNHETGDFVLGLLITTRAAGDDTLTLFERYAPYKGALSSK